ncbi:MAG: hypothetical protein HKP59_12715 [Lutibacter sp.]|uniref:DUF6428 family protein n=1 Tax=Lutibacter sp. TaxID=1925666 RepID=UPI0018102275|nr:DUF6428 family protein [Lutibacter sp.]MBT8318477.1 hypothetical protein [Lutibacter sp.]NNJ59335.1 hypothetical protein [Lutibacter sp.]
MKIEEIKEYLRNLNTIAFQLPDGNMVPSHFHVTEVGKVTKHFIDCGGTVRNEAVANFQLWEANDYNHRLHPEKLIHIIELSDKILNLENLEIEVEYQGLTIGKYDLDFDGINFLLTTKQTNCLAKDACDVSIKKSKVKLSNIVNTTSNCCAPASNCC